jgi:AcrR family transcriptional regulator
VPRTKPAPEQQPATPRSRKGAATRARLLEAAKPVFEEAGFLEARITDISERAGVSHGSFYHYFDSKEQIFREIAEAQEAHLTAPSTDPGADGDAEIDADGDAETDGDGDRDGEQVSEWERIRRANRRYLERYRDNGKIMGVIEEVSRYDAYVNEARMRRQRHFADRAEKAIRRLQAEGAADPEIDPQIAAVALGSMVGRFAEIWLVEDWATFDFDTAVDQITRLWANAIGVHAPARKRRRRSG